MKIFSGIIIITSVFLLMGCGAKLGVGPPSAFIFSYYKAPMYFKAPPEGGLKLPNDLKTGKVTASNLIIPQTYNTLSAGWGNIALDKAAEEAGMKEIYFVDYSYLSIFRLYNKATLYVHGK